MYKGIFILYLVCFGCYLLFTRQPDYFDGEKIPATIHWLKDSASGINIPKAVYKEGNITYAIDARYPLREWKEGDTLTVIYEIAKPSHAAVYRFWGYGITWGELLTSIVLCVALFQVAVAITSNPTPESLVEQLDYKEEKRRRYKEE